MSISPTARRDSELAPADRPPPSPRRGRLSISALISRNAVLLYLIVVLIVFSTVRSSTFGTLVNYQAVLSLQAVVVIVALAGAIALLVGEFDISVANNTALCAALVIGLQVNQHLAWPLALLATLGVALLVGLINGFVVVKLHVSSFVATLGTFTLLEAAWTWYLKGEAIVPTNALPSAFVDLGRAKALGLGVPVFIALALAVVAWVVTSYLPLGRRMYAVGGSRDAARLSGIATERIVLWSFVVGGLLAGIAGVVLGAEYDNASPGAGSELLFPAFAAVFLGATTVKPGRYNVIGTVISVYAIAFMIDGLQQLGGVWAQQWVGPAFDGASLIVAVSLSVGVTRLRDRRAAEARLKALVTGVEPANAPRDAT